MPLFTSLRDFLMQCTRVWAITKKPSNLEFKIVAKASAIGILLIGFVGFAVSMMIRVFKP